MSATGRIIIINKPECFKYIWETGEEDPRWMLDDPVQGVNGWRKIIIDHVQDNDRVLDIGCGVGMIYELLKYYKKQVDYLGIDIIQEYLDIAKKYFPGIKTEQQDMHFLPWKENDFDVSILFTVVEGIPDFRKAIDEAWRVSKKKIIVVITIPLIESLDENAYGVQDPQPYVVRIQRSKFTNYINSLTSDIESGTFEYEGEIKSWYWILKK